MPDVGCRNVGYKDETSRVELTLGRDYSMINMPTTYIIVHQRKAKY